jgi:hypothetical protein
VLAILRWAASSGHLGKGRAQRQCSCRHTQLTSVGTACSKPDLTPSRPSTCLMYAFAAVRFGKYAPMRSKDKKVHILVNGALRACAHGCSQLPRPICQAGCITTPCTLGGMCLVKHLVKPNVPGQTPEISLPPALRHVQQGRRQHSACTWVHTVRPTLLLRRWRSSAVRVVQHHSVASSSCVCVCVCVCLHPFGKQPAQLPTPRTAATTKRKPLLLLSPVCCFWYPPVQTLTTSSCCRG